MSGSRDPNRRLNIMISGWICIAIGSGVTLSEATNFSLFLSAPLSIGGIVLLLIGLTLEPDSEKTEITLSEEE